MLKVNVYIRYRHKVSLCPLLKRDVTVHIGIEESSRLSLTYVVEQGTGIKCIFSVPGGAVRTVLISIMQSPSNTHQMA